MDCIGLLRSRPRVYGTTQKAHCSITTWRQDKENQHNSAGGRYLLHVSRSGHSASGQLVMQQVVTRHSEQRTSSTRTMLLQPRMMETKALVLSAGRTGATSAYVSSRLSCTFMTPPWGCSAPASACTPSNCHTVHLLILCKQLQDTRRGPTHLEQAQQAWQISIGVRPSHKVHASALQQGVLQALCHTAQHTQDWLLSLCLLNAFTVSAHVQRARAGTQQWLHLGKAVTQHAQS